MEESQGYIDTHMQMMLILTPLKSSMMPHGFTYNGEYHIVSTDENLKAEDNTST